MPQNNEVHQIILDYEDDDDAAYQGYMACYQEAAQFLADQIGIPLDRTVPPQQLFRQLLTMINNTYTDSTASK